jgi:hypothetical protein
MKTYFTSLQVMKGRPRAPHVQGFIERGNVPFKQALQDRVQVNNTDSWHVGALIASQHLNSHFHEGIDIITPFQIYCSQEHERMFEDILGESAWHILTEVGWQAIEGVMEHLKKFPHLEDDNLPIEERQQFDMGWQSSMNNKLLHRSLTA